MQQNMQQILGNGLLLTLLLVISYFALLHPLYTWDLVPYVAAVLSGHIDDPAILHRETYQLLQATLSQAQYAGLTSGAYAGDLAQNAEHFHSQLNMYYVKPLYIGVLRVCYFLGLNPITSIMIISLVSGLGLCLLVYSWLKTLTSPLNAGIIVILFAVMARLLDLSRVPTPDNFSAFVLLLGLYLLLVKQWLVPAATLLCASILVRTNNMIFVGLVFTLLLWQRFGVSKNLKDSQFVVVAIAMAASCFFYLATNTAFDYQWWRLFYHTFVQSQVDISAFDGSFTLEVYFSVLKSATQQILAPGAAIASSLPAFLLLLFIGTKQPLVNIRSFLRPTGSASLWQLSLLCLPVFITVFLLFPLALGLDRFFTVYYGLILINLVSSWRTHEKTTC